MHITCGLRRSIHSAYEKRNIDNLERIDDMWPISDGQFVPQIWSKPTTDSERARVEQILNSIGEIYPTASLYLRGSMLEQEMPHPLSDIDLVILAPRKHRSEIEHLCKEHLRIFGRPLDIQFLDPEEGFDDWEHAYLRNRTHLVCGPKHIFIDVPITIAFCQLLWKNLGIHKIPQRLPKPGFQRVQVVKCLLRAIGIIILTKSNMFSRDLKRCIEWSKELDTDMGKELELLYMSLDSGKFSYTQGDHATFHPLTSSLQKIQTCAKKLHLF